MAINITEEAAEKVRDLIPNFIKECSDKGIDVKEVFLRTGVRGGGCSGVSYILELDVETGSNDLVFPDEKMKNAGLGINWGFKIVCDKKSYLHIIGMTIIYREEGLQGGFDYINPNAKSTCGCGTSFSP